MIKIDDRLIDKIKSGDIKARGKVYVEYAPLLLGVCQRYTKNISDAEDVLQESFIDIFGKIDQLKDNKAFKPWMVRIAVNNSLTYLKQKQSHLDIDEYSESYSEEDDSEKGKDIKDRILDGDISQADMLSIINNLPTGFRTVFNLYVFEKLKHQEIAEKLSISVSTSKSQLLRARKIIQKKLSEHLEDKEKRDKRKLLILSLPLLMNDDLSYIDELVHSKLNDIATVPSASAQQAFQKAMTAKQSTLAVVKSKLLATIATKAILIPSTLIVTTVVGVMLINNYSVTENNSEPFVVSDSIQVDENKQNEIITVVEHNDSDQDNNIKIEQKPAKGEVVTVLKTVTPVKTRAAETPKETKPAKAEKVEKLKETDQVLEKAPVKTVYVKKVVKVKQQKVIIDTVIKTDTLNLY